MINHLLHAALFLLSIVIVWMMSGILIKGTQNVAKRYNKPGFAVAFFVLGFLTSISELSVAFNATLSGVPQVSAGNLVGASIVIFLLIIPLFAIVSGRISLDHAISKPNLALALMIVCVPAILAFDGAITRLDSALLLCLYAMLVYRLRKKQPIETIIQEMIAQVEEEITNKRRATAIDILYITFGALLIFFAGKILVDESVYFTVLFGLPTSIAGLLVLSIGTNIPELMIGIRAIVSKQNEIAFGDYLGSAIANVPLFGLLGVANGHFRLDAGEFAWSAAILIPGLFLFFLFALSKNELSRKEGSVLLGLYVCFLVAQVMYLV